MIDPQFPTPPQATDGPAPPPLATHWGEVSRNRWAKKLGWRSHLAVFLISAVLLSLIIGVFALSSWHKLRSRGGAAFLLPEHVYLHGRCFHRFKAGVVPDSLCEEALHLSDEKGGRRPRFIFNQQNGDCYDTILNTRHKVPLEFCNRKRAAP